MSSVVSHRRSPRLAAAKIATARATFLASKGAYESAYTNFQTSYPIFMTAIQDFTAKHITRSDYQNAAMTRNAARARYDTTYANFIAARTAYVGLVGDDNID